MEVSLIFKIAAVGILVSVISQILKHSGREEQAFLTSLAGLLLVLYWIVPYISDLFESMKKCLNYRRERHGRNQSDYGGVSRGVSGGGFKKRKK